MEYVQIKNGRGDAFSPPENAHGMKLIFKGKFTSYDALPKGELPENAKAFKEPKTMVGINLTALLFALPAAIVMFILLPLFGGSEMYDRYKLWGFVIALALAPLHEYIHALFCGKNAEVYMYYSLKHFMMFVLTLTPMTKARFIVMSFMPSFILGWLTFFAGLLLCPTTALGGILMSAGVFGALMGGGDYMNMFNAAVQMPKGALTQLSGMHSYWFMPENDSRKIYLNGKEQEV